MNSFLSICIPTYNRIQSLQAELEYLLPVTSKLGVPIYISDNASSDGTEDMVKSLQQEYKLLYYNRNFTNLGPDYNFEHVLKMSSAQYAWLLSDDDIIKRECVIDVIDELEKYKPDLMVVNGCTDHVRVTDIPTQCYTDANKVLNDIGWHMQWMSCLIYSRKMIKTSNFEMFKDSYLLQFGIIFEYLSKCDLPYIYWNESKLVTQSEITNGETMTSWSDKTFLIFTKNWCSIINNFDPSCYTSAAKSKCIMDHGIKSGLFTIKSIVVMSLKGIFTRRVLRNYSYYIKQAIDISYWKLYIIALLPILNDKQFLKLKKIYKHIKW